MFEWQVHKHAIPWNAALYAKDPADYQTVKSQACTHTHTHTHLYAHRYVCMYRFYARDPTEYVYIYIYMYVCIHMYICMYVYVYMYICICVYVHIYYVKALLSTIPSSRVAGGNVGDVGDEQCPRPPLTEPE